MKDLLIVIDYQNDFVDGALGFSGAEKLEPYIVSKIEETLKAGNDLIFTYDTHNENYMETEEGKNLPIPHCIKNSKGWQLYGKVDEYKGKAIKLFDKPTFGSLELGKWLEEKDYKNITIVGLVSNICVISNAVIAKAALPNAHIIVEAKGTDSFDKDLNTKTLDVLKGLQIEVK